MGTPKEALAKGVEVYNSRDRTAWMSLCAPDVMINREPAGAAGWVWHYDVLCEAFPDSRPITSSVEEGDSLGYEVTFTGTHTGNLRTPRLVAGPTDKSVKVEYAGFIRVAEEKVCSLNIYGLDCALSQQLDLAAAHPRSKPSEGLPRASSD